VLALAHHFAAMIRAGDVADYADLARLTGFTRARITQMMDLTLLAPDIQGQILTWPRVSGERGAPSEKRVLVVAREVEWGRQRERWETCGPASAIEKDPAASLTKAIRLGGS
jgi:alkylated DNA nucleotide flippase Atl1